jgi:arylsulfatase
MDVGSPVDFTYDLPFAFTGKIEQVHFKLGKTDIGQAKAGGTVATKEAKG